MIVGFTGVRHGMTDAQRAMLGTVALIDIKSMITEFHHGGCQGADVEAARLVSHMFGEGVRIICHPGPLGDKHQEISGVDDERLPAKTHFARNRDIVDACDVLLVCPMQMEYQPRGGTWYTHDQAVKKGKRVIICWPDGTTLDIATAH